LGINSTNARFFDSCNVAAEAGYAMPGGKTQAIYFLAIRFVDRTAYNLE
jgi:hypothetical protein